MSDITIAGATFSDVTKIQIPKSGSGSQEFTDNGTYDVSALAQAIVNVSGGGGGGGWETETGTWTPSSNVGRGTVDFQNQHTDPPCLIVLSDVADAVTDLTRAGMFFAFIDIRKMFGGDLPYTSDANKAAIVLRGVRSSVTTTTISTYWLDDNGGTGSGDVAYYRTNTYFRPITDNTYGQFWQSTRTYKWVAFWKPQS